MGEGAILCRQSYFVWVCVNIRARELASNYAPHDGEWTCWPVAARGMPWLTRNGARVMLRVGATLPRKGKVIMLARIGDRHMDDGPSPRSLLCLPRRFPGGPVMS
jgi:hypothetical protein